MGLQFRPAAAPALEAVNLDNKGPNDVNMFQACFTNYGNWAREIAATSASLSILPSDHLVKGMIPVAKANLLTKTITALNKLLQNVLSKREALELTEVSGIKELEKVGMTATPSIIDYNKFKDNTWIGNIPKGPVALKKNGWTPGNAQTFAKQVQNVLEDVGDYPAFKNSMKAMTDKLTKNANTSSADRKKLSAATKQAVHLFKVRHSAIARAYRLFSSLKKTI